MSAAHAQANPAPAHGPLMAANVTLGMSWSNCDVRTLRRKLAMSDSMGRALDRSPAVAFGADSDVAPTTADADRGAAMPCKSPPAQKPRPAPVRITARTASSEAASSKAASASFSSASFMVLRCSGRLRVIVATRPSTSYKTVLSIVLPSSSRTRTFTLCRVAGQIRRPATSPRRLYVDDQSEVRTSTTVVSAGTFRTAG